MTLEFLLLILLILAGSYMAWNIGANDVANAMGTSVGSKALTLRQAVIVAAILEFAGAFFFGSHVSETIQTGIINTQVFADEPLVLVYGMLSSLLAAGIWLQIASYYGLPVSTTHSIVGAVVGFGAVFGGLHSIYWSNVLYIATSWLLSPLCGALTSYLIFSFLRKKIFFAADPVEATKKLAPFLAFLVITILVFITAFNHIEDTSEESSSFQHIALTVFFGVCGFIAAKLFLRQQFSIHAKTQAATGQSSDVAIQLEKAKRHLAQAQAFSENSMEGQIGELLNKIESLTRSLKTRERIKSESGEYAVIEKIFGYLQVMSACLMAFAHGANDVANAIGPLAAAIGVLTTGKVLSASILPTWLLALGGFGIVVGLATWGWRVIETIGKKITELTPTRGFSAEFGAATTILLASRLGLPISTTHTLVGAVIGVGLARGLEAIDMRTTREIAISWIVTIPAGAFITIFVYSCLHWLLYPLK